MQRLEAALRTRYLAVDGAMGTELIARGLLPGDCPDAWNLTRPEAVQAVHRAYCLAGADVIETNTFGANRYTLARHNLAGDMRAINLAGARLARETAGADRYVMGSMGPTGVFMEPYGDETEESVTAAFAAQAAALEEGGADAAIAETFTCIEECCAALRAIRGSTGLTAAASFTFDPLPDGSYASMMGVTPQQFAAAARAAGAHIIGANCGLGPEHMLRVIAELRAAVPPGTPILAMPNAGMPRCEGGKTIFPESPETFAAHIPALREAGATLIGGCCGTAPSHIEMIAKTIHTW